MSPEPTDFRSQLLGSFRSKRVGRNVFWPMLMRNFYESLPDYQDLLRAGGKSLADTTPALVERHRYCTDTEAVGFRVAYCRGIDSAFIGWCQANPVKVTVDPSVARETHVDGATTRYVTKTPVGEIVSRDDVSPISHCSYVVKRPIKTLADLRVFRYVTEATRYEPRYDDAPARQAVIGQAGLMTGGGFNCPFHDLLYLFDAADLLMMSFDMPREVRETIDLLHAKKLEVVKILAGSPFDVFDHDSLWDIRQISPAIYREYYAPFQKDYNDILHAGGKFGFDHASGQDITPYLEAVESAGFDIIYGLRLGEDNVDQAAELQTRWEGRTVGVVGPDPDYLRRMTADQIRRLCGAFLASLGDRKVVMCSSDSVVPDTPIENLLAVSQELRAR